MSDYLGILISRSFGLARVAKPRLASTFEPTYSYRNPARESLANYIEQIGGMRNEIRSSGRDASGIGIQSGSVRYLQYQDHLNDELRERAKDDAIESDAIRTVDERNAINKPLMERMPGEGDDGAIEISYSKQTASDNPGIDSISRTEGNSLFSTIDLVASDKSLAEKRHHEPIIAGQSMTAIGKGDPYLPGMEGHGKEHLGISASLGRGVEEIPVSSRPIEASTSEKASIISKVEDSLGHDSDRLDGSLFGSGDRAQQEPAIDNGIPDAKNTSILPPSEASMNFSIGRSPRIVDKIQPSEFLGKAVDTGSSINPEGAPAGRAEGSWLDHRKGMRERQVLFETQTSGDIAGLYASGQNAKIQPSSTDLSKHDLSGAFSQPLDDAGRIATLSLASRAEEKRHPKERPVSYAETSVQPEKSIKVIIGRIDIQAVPPPQEQAHQNLASKVQILSLDDYLKSRKGGTI